MYAFGLIGYELLVGLRPLPDPYERLEAMRLRCELGLAYLEAGMFAQADSEFDRCIKRRGEALALFIDEEQTYGYLPAVYYYQGRAREGLKRPTSSPTRIANI